MKKIYYLLAFVSLAFTACQKQPVIPQVYTKSMTFTLTQTDYQLLPSSDYPYYTYTFDNVADANKYIPIILNARDPQLGDGSTANVTYTTSAPYVKVADTLYSDVAYTVSSADYFAVTGNHYGDFSSSNVLAFLKYKYPEPANSQLAVITYVLYSGGADATVTNSFLYLNGAWKQIYMISPAQYAVYGDGKYDQFSSSSDAYLPQYFNALLKADLTVSDTVKTGDVEYVSFNYYSSTGATDQRVLPLVFNGTNFVTTASTTNTLEFLKSGGAWIPNPTVYYTLTSADTKLIATSTIGTDAERTNLGKYGDFSGWATADLDNAIILVLTTDFPNPKVGVPYNVTYLNYTGGADVPTVITFKYNGTAWAAQ